MRIKKMAFLLISCLLCIFVVGCDDYDTSSLNLDDDVVRLNESADTSAPNSKGENLMSDIKVKATDIYRGDEAQSIVDDYNENTSNLKVVLSYANTNDLEFGVCDVEITVPEDLDVSEEGISSLLDFKILGTDKKDLIFNKIKYTDLPGTLITPTKSLQPGETVKASYAFTIPKDCKEYLIAIGNEYFTRAFYLGK